ncbi:MAG: hypothetical protein ACLRQF_06550 [Thomasclavelia ramosa]
MPMVDTLATNYCHKTGGNYGSIRGMGSLGYAGRNGCRILARFLVLMEQCLQHMPFY